MSTPSRILRNATKPSQDAPPTTRRREPASEGEGRSEDEDDEDDTYGGVPLPLPTKMSGTQSEEKKHAEGNGGTREQESEREKKPYFFPPLWLQRRTAIAELLKAEGVKTVADLGCGHGALLSLLALPAYHVDDFPLSSSSYTSSTSSDPPRVARTREEKLALLSSLSLSSASSPSSTAQKELHLTRLIGVDLDPTACRAAIESCTPRKRPQWSSCGEGEGGEEEEERVDNETRWEELRVEVWQGGVEVFNEALVGVDAIVLTEVLFFLLLISSFSSPSQDSSDSDLVRMDLNEQVIEHLTPLALSRLPHLLFTLYRPRLILITTPNHSFNAYFPPSSSSSSSSSDGSETNEDAHRWPDPTGRTNPRRVFRDPTHLFEFTAPEFRQWVEASLPSSSNAYEVTYTGVGSLSSYYATSSPSYHSPVIPFPPPGLEGHPALKDDPALQGPLDPQGEGREFYATQIAVFKRREGDERAGKQVVKEGGDEKQEEQREKEQEEGEERSPRSTRPTPLPFYTGSSPSLSSSTSSPPLASTSHSTSLSPPAQLPLPFQELVSSLSLPAHPCTTTSPSSHPPSQEKIRAALAALFTLHRSPSLSLADIWRLGTGTREGACVRALVGGRVGGVVEALVGSAEGEEEEEWEMELLPTHDDEGEGQGTATKVGRTPMERVRVRWRGYVEPPISEGEEEGGWGEEEEEVEDAEDDREGDEGEYESLPLPLPLPSSSAAGWRTGEAGERGWDSEVREAGWEQKRSGKTSAEGIGGWGEDPW